MVGLSVQEALRQRRASLSEAGWLDAPAHVLDRGREAVLRLNQQQRQGLAGLNPGGARHAFGKGTQTWGRNFLRIPEEDLLALTLRNPALASLNPKEFSAAWLEFERSDESLPYRVTEDYRGPSKPVLFGAG